MWGQTVGGQPGLLAAPCLCVCCRPPPHPQLPLRHLRGAGGTSRMQRFGKYLWGGVLYGGEDNDCTAVIPSNPTSPLRRHEILRDPEHERRERSRQCRHDPKQAYDFIYLQLKMQHKPRSKIIAVCTLELFTLPRKTMFPVALRLIAST